MPAFSSRAPGALENNDKEKLKRFSNEISPGRSLPPIWSTSSFLRLILAFRYSDLFHGWSFSTRVCLRINYEKLLKSGTRLGGYRIDSDCLIVNFPEQYF